MKHRPETQASGVYDANADSKLVKAAYDFNLQFASKFVGPATQGGPPGDGGAASDSNGWTLVDPQPESFEFKRVKDSTFACTVQWNPSFAPGMKFRLQHVPAAVDENQSGMEWRLPEDAQIVGKPLSVQRQCPASFLEDSFTASGLMMQLQSPPQPQQPRSHEQPSMAEQQAPSPQHRDPVPSCVRPKLAAAQVVSELAEIHFSVRSAARNGDCLPLSAMAGFEISRDEALSPTKEAVADVLSLRNRAVELVTSEDGVGGIDAATFRASELLPLDTPSTKAALEHWKEVGHWIEDNKHLSATFTLGVAASLGRPICVLERDGDFYLDPVRLYGGVDPDTGALLRSAAKPGAPATIPTYTLMPFSELIQTLRKSSTSLSLVEFDGVDHYSPILDDRPHPRQLKFAVGEVLEWREDVTQGCTTGFELHAGKVTSIDAAGIWLEVRAQTRLSYLTGWYRTAHARIAGAKRGDEESNHGRVRRRSSFDLQDKGGPRVRLGAYCARPVPISLGRSNRGWRGGGA